MFVSPGLPKDPYDSEWVLGWGVLHGDTGRVKSLFGSEVEAQLTVHLLGGDYRVQYGTYRVSENAEECGHYGVNTENYGEMPPRIWRKATSTGKER